MHNVAILVPALALSALVAGPARAADEAPGPALNQALPTAATATIPPPVEETPGFQALRPLPGAVPQTALPSAAQPPAPPVSPSPAVAPSPAAPPAPAPRPVAPAAPAVVQPPPPAAPAAEPAAETAGGFTLPLEALVAGLAAAAGGGVAALSGLWLMHRRDGLDEARRLRAVAATLAIELESRRQAFETVPAPPNAEAGVSFVSAVSALADLDCGWRAMQAELHRLPEKLAGHLAVHYGAVRHVATFVKGQSLAAALRMLQANRIGGHPCPDAGAMREAHVELAAAFRGVDKLIQALRALG